LSLSALTKFRSLKISYDITVHYQFSIIFFPAALPIFSARSSHDPFILPVVYDFPQCSNLTDSILNCPRVVSSIPGVKTNTRGRTRRQAGNPSSSSTGTLGRLLAGVTGSNAGIDLVGVRCEGM